MPPPGQVQRAESKFIVFEQFEKMNTQSVRQALNEKELAWLENLQPIAPNNLVTVPGPNTAISNIADSINLQYYANIGAVDYIISFTTNGAGWATNIATGISARFASPGTFSNPDMTVWQSLRILINDPTAGYSTWDGTAFVQQGGVSPVITLTAPGANYTSPPTVTITGGSGTGATAVATIGTPAVVAVNVINGGSGYGPAPGVVFAGGGGIGAAATATIDPRGVNTVTVTNPGAYRDINLPTPVVTSFSGGGGSGATAQSTFSVNAFGFFVVTGISIVTAGSGYTSAPAVVFSGGTFGAGGFSPAATCTVGNGRVLSITVTSGGSGYTSAPSVSFTGGGAGSGATAAAVVGGSGVTSVTLTNPGAGYLASDVLTVGFSGGGGTGASATAHVWPFVPKGNTLAVFGGRVWLNGMSPGGNFRLLQYTGTAGFDDFSATNASGSLTITDADLTHSITALRNFNNYLWIMGDQSVKQIGNISLNSLGNITLFTILTLSSDQGTIYTNSCGSFNRVFFFANTNGVYAVFGSSVQKVSDDMDGIFRLIDFTQEPQSCIADINNIHHIAWLVRYKDPLANERSILLAFTDKKWFVINQGTGLTAVATASTLASGRTLTFASSGQDITQILANAAQPVVFKLQTALTHHGNAVQRKKTLRIGFAATTTANVKFNVSMDTNEGSQTYLENVVAGFNALTVTGDGAGRYLGATVTGTLANFTMTNLTLEYQETNVGNK
jgi:hypothetical protein